VGGPRARRTTSRGTSSLRRSWRRSGGPASTSRSRRTQAPQWWCVPACSARAPRPAPPAAPRRLGARPDRVSSLQARKQRPDGTWYVTGARPSSALAMLSAISDSAHAAPRRGRSRSLCALPPVRRQRHCPLRVFSDSTGLREMQAACGRGRRRGIQGESAPAVPQQQQLWPPVQPHEVCSKCGRRPERC
jgi:hypothetical protein